MVFSAVCLILLTCVPSLFIFASLARGLSILFIFFVKEPDFVSLIFPTVYLFQFHFFYYFPPVCFGFILLFFF